MKEPQIVVIDDYLEDPDSVRRLAMSFPYVESEYHKGRRTPQQFLSTVSKDDFGKLLHRKITKWQDHGMNGKFQICLAGEQIVYHSDYQSHAGILFLTPDAPMECGLSLYKSKTTGLRKMPEDGSLQQTMYDGKLLDRTAWEEVDRIGNLYNRLVLWEGTLVHAPSGYFGNNLQNGRLFQIFFFDAE